MGCRARWASSATGTSSEGAGARAGAERRRRVPGGRRVSPRPRHRIPRRLLASPVHLLSFGFGAGLSPRAPGTLGTLVGIPLYLLLAALPPAPYLLTCAVLFLLGVALCGHSARTLGVHDHPGIVWDEIVGYAVTMFAVPPGWGTVVAGFVCFRVFDIWKPWPVSTADRRVSGGFGIMFDDLLAAVYAALVMHAGLWGISTLQGG